MKRFYSLMLGLALISFGATAQVQVTFQVDLTDYLAAGNTMETVKIAGNFTTIGASVPDWSPPDGPAFTDMGNDVWSATIDFPASSVGQSLEFKFLNTADSWGDCGLQQECMTAGEDDECKNPSNDNRLLVIPAENTTLCYTWETCNGCNFNGTDETLVDLGISISPNPIRDRAVIDFATSLNQAQIRLTSLTGQAVRTFTVSGDQLIIERDGLQAGLYLLQVVTENGQSVAEKLMVE